jgi:hypothetical protein
MQQLSKCAIDLDVNHTSSKFTPLLWRETSFFNRKNSNKYKEFPIHWPILIIAEKHLLWKNKRAGIDQRHGRFAKIKVGDGLTPLLIID